MVTTNVKLKEICIRYSATVGLSSTICLIIAIMINRPPSQHFSDLSVLCEWSLSLDGLEFETDNPGNTSSEWTRG